MSEIRIRSRHGYWDVIASDYDHLYSSDWSARENRSLGAFLATHALSTEVKTGPAVIVDLGCGTGLGFDLLKRSSARGDVLVGMDVSVAMAAICQRKHPDSRVLVGDIEHEFASLPTKIDSILMLSAVGSYVDNLHHLLANLRRMLNPNARVVVSVLNRFSLRRLARRRLGRIENYHTRGVQTESTAPEVRVYGRRDFEKLVHTAGFRVAARHVGSPFAGILETPRIWEVGAAIARAAPWASHSTEYVIVRNGT